MWMQKNWLTKVDVMMDLFGILFSDYINLDYINCKCRITLIDKLVDECSEDIIGNKVIYNATLYDH